MSMTEHIAENLGISSVSRAATRQPADPPGNDPGRLRRAICAATILATVPYLVLKVLWVCGVEVGVHGSGMRSGTMAGVNTLTIAMDGVAALVALALVRPWGLRAPAWLLVFPMWVATGFLAPLAVGAPLATVASLVSGQTVTKASTSSPESLDGWVFALVYTGFGLQALGLGAGFVLHARARWGRLLRLRLRDLPVGPTDVLRRVVVSGVSVFALVPITAHLYWAAGGSVGHPVTTNSAASRWALESVFGLLPLVGVVGTLILVHRRDAAPARWALIAAWTGTASMFAWGMWWELAGSLNTPMTAGKDLRGVTGIGGAQMLAGAVLATVLAVLVAEAAATSNADDLAGDGA